MDDFIRAWNALMSALGIQSLHLTPTPTGKLDSRYEDGNDGGGGTAPSVPVLGVPNATSSSTVDVPLLTAATGPSTPITYVLEKSTSAISGFTVADSGNIFDTDGIASLTGLTANTTHYFRAKAVGADLNESTYSEVVSVTTPAVVADTTAPTIPTGLTLTNITASSITPTWTASTDAVGVTGYDVVRGIGDGSGNPVGTGSVIATVAGTSYTDGGLSASQQYYYRIHARDAAGNVSNPTSRVYGTTSAPPVTLAFLGDFEEGTLNLSKFTWSKNGANSQQSVQNTIKRYGSYALRNRIQKTVSGDATNFRSEVNCLHPVPVWAEDWWIGFSIYLPSDYVDDPLSEIITQFRHRPDADQQDTGNPPCTISVVNGQLRLGIRYQATHTTVPDQDATNITKSNLWPQSSMRGHWTDFVFRMRWNYVNVGSPGIGMWINDTKIDLGGTDGDYRGQVGYNSTRPFIMKAGIYKSLWKFNDPSPGASEKIIYHDEIRIVGPTGNFDVVKPPGTRT